MAFTLNLKKFLVPGVLLFAALFSLIGGYGSTRIGIDLFLYGEASETWPSVIGRIDDSFLAHEDSESGSITRAYVEYSYTVNGNPYRGRRIGFGDFGAGPGDHAEQIVAKYPKGAEVPVYYLESTPRISTLKRGLFESPWPSTLIGLLFMAVSGILGAVAYRQAKA